MQRSVTTCTMLALMVSIPAVDAKESGFGSIHVLGQPGSVVFIDDKPTGVSIPGEDGITFPDVAPGKHSVRVTRVGFRSKTLAVTVVAGETAEIEAGELSVHARIRWRPRGGPVETTVDSPPMVIEDTSTPGDHAVEANFLIEGDFQSGAKAIESPEIDLNYGIGENMQLEYQVPWGWTRTTVRDEFGNESTETSYGVGNSSFGVKYRFYDNEDDGLSFAIFPQVEFRTPGAKRAADGGIATNDTTWMLPALLTKDYERFSITANLDVEKSTADPHAIGFGGVGLGMRMTNHVALLTEIAAREIGNGSEARTQIDVGARFKLNESHSLMGSAGTDIGAGGDAHRFVTLAYQLLMGRRDLP